MTITVLPIHICGTALMIAESLCEECSTERHQSRSIIAGFCQSGGLSVKNAHQSDNFPSFASLG